MNFLKKLYKIPNYIALGVLWVYRATLSPSTGVLRNIPFYPRNTCIFYPTCSEYSSSCFKKYPFHKAFLKTITRVRRCHPGNEPAVDLP